MRRLAEGEEPIRCLVRPISDAGGLEQLGVEVCRGDLADRESVRAAFRGVRVVLHLAHICYAQTVLDCADAEVERLVLISSLRRFSRVPDPSVDEVIRAEALVLQSQRPWVILRPAMIYGFGDDRNISRLATRLRRRRFTPIPGSGRNLHQPVFVEDVVAGILAAAETPGIEGRLYALAGGEALSYDALVDAVGRAVGVRPLKIHLPLGWALLALRVLGWLGMRSGIDHRQVLRLQEDKAFSIAEAREDLGYQPLSFAAGLAKVYGE
jgi:nucleoside-diphosphate-sugar epimerase